MIIPGFWEYYPKAISALLTGNLRNWTKYSELVFPRAAKCTYESYGPSGSLQKFDALCLLSLNILNQKLFVVIWIWFTVQLILSILNLLYWIVVSSNEKARISILFHKTMKSIPHKIIQEALSKANLGQFFVLNQIAKNVSALSFIEIISDLSDVNENKLKPICEEE